MPIPKKRLFSRGSVDGTKLGSNLRLHSRVYLAMGIAGAISIVANFLLIGGLIFYGFVFFAQYHSTGKWAKNITSLLAGVGMLTLAFALTITPRNVDVLAHIAATKASVVFLVVSSVLLLAAIAAFGIITYWRPRRLWHERKLERDLSRGLPNIR